MKATNPVNTISKPIINPEMSNSIAPNAELIKMMVPAMSKIIEIITMKSVYSSSFLFILNHHSQF